MLETKNTIRRFSLKQALLALCLLSSILLLLAINRTIASLPIESDYFQTTTLGDLALWMSEQSAQAEPEALFSQWTRNRAVAEDLEVFPVERLWLEFHTALVLYTGALTVLGIIASLAMLMKRRGHRILLVTVLIGTNLLLFNFPPSDSSPIVSLLLTLLALLGLTMLLFSDKLERAVGFLVLVSLFNVLWEGSKVLADSLDYKITLPVPTWQYTTYPTLDDALSAVQNGDIQVILADRNQIRDLLPEVGAEPIEGMTYPDLLYLSNFTRSSYQWGFPVLPELQGRVSLVLAQSTAVTSLTDLETMSIGTYADAFVIDDFLQVERELTLVDMKIANDLNLPHLQSIAEALLQPARRNGTLLLVRILYQAVLYTLTEAAIGFTLGMSLGFLLASLFAHVALLQRSLLPYVIASQTIPIIALAPMIVIWLRDTNPIIPVAIISAYLTFFPVTINTLRGLQSPDPMAFDLMQSYAASRWQTMWKLRFPSALPMLFTALKVSATASVVGAIIGELPSGIRNGLGRAILDFSSDYSLTSTPKLWGAIFIAALLGMLCFLTVVLVEKLFIRGEGKSA